MKINTFGEFYTFLKNNKLENLNSDIADFTACISQYNMICTCKKQIKINKGEHCKNLYINIVKNILPLFKNQILTTANTDSITFCYNNNFVIDTLSR